MDKVSRAVETACANACHKSMSEMIRQVVEAFVDVKMQRADISIAFARQIRHRHDALSNVGRDAVGPRVGSLAGNISQSARTPSSAVPILHGGGDNGGWLGFSGVTT
jgi:hypothetical protein